MEIEGWRRVPPTEPSDFDMPDQFEDPIPHAARMRAIGDLLARGIRRLQELKGHDIRRRSGDEEILAFDPATCPILEITASGRVERHCGPRGDAADANPKQGDRMTATEQAFDLASERGELEAMTMNAS